MSGEPRVLLTFERGDIIAAKQFGYIDGPLIGVVAKCEDGSSRLFAVTAEPTNAELYDIKVAADASYEEKLEAIEPAMEEIDDRGDDPPDIGTLKQIDEWLNAKAELDEDQLEGWGGRAGQYEPGFIIMDALTPDERKALGLREQDLGGPASWVPCISTTASLEQLNEMLARKKLPFVVIDDEGSEDWH